MIPKRVIRRRGFVVLVYQVGDLCVSGAGQRYEDAEAEAMRQMVSALEANPHVSHQGALGFARERLKFLALEARR